MYTFIYMYVFMAMSVCVCVCTLCVCVFVYVLVRRDMCVRLFVCVCLRPCACVCARTNACQMFTYPVFVCVRVYRYVCKSIRMICTCNCLASLHLAAAFVSMDLLRYSLTWAFTVFLSVCSCSPFLDPWGASAWVFFVFIVSRSESYR